MPALWRLCVVIVETGSHFIVQIGLKLETIVVTQLPECDHRAWFLLLSLRLLSCT